MNPLPRNTNSRATKASLPAAMWKTWTSVILILHIIYSYGEFFVLLIVVLWGVGVIGNGNYTSSVPWNDDDDDMDRNLKRVEP